MSPLSCFLLAAAAGVLIAASVRRYALARALLDPVEQRRLHRIPTPRGGGLAMVLPVLVALLGLAVAAGRPGDYAPAAALALVALVGWLDDHGGLPVLPRLAAHALAGVLIAAWLGQLLPASLLGVLLMLVAFGLTVTAINFTNFVDGANGMVALPTLAVAGVAVYGASQLPAVLGAEAALLSTVGAVLAGSTLGFLPWNWPRARLFMGDVGSGGLGLVLAVLILQSVVVAPWLALALVLILAPHALDATLTLAQRAWRREPVWIAHRQHLYQWWVRCGASHAAVSLAYLAVGIVGMLWIVPAARADGTFPTLRSSVWGALLVLLWLYGKHLLWKSRRRRRRT